VVGACRSDFDWTYVADALLAAIQVDLYLYQRQTLGWSIECIMTGLSFLVEGLATTPLHLSPQVEMYKVKEQEQRKNRLAVQRIGEGKLEPEG
jgi:hypothetical protein